MTQQMRFQDTIYQLADELRATASQGLHFAEEPSIKERYTKVLTASARVVGILEQRPAKDVLTQYGGARRRWGPLLTSSAAVVRDGRLLLVRRRDTGLWCLPRDVVRAGELMAESAQSSLRDQVGIGGEAIGLLGVFDSRTWRYPAKSQFYQVVFRVEPHSDQSLDSAEEAVRFVWVEDVAALSAGVDPVVPTVLDLLRREDDRPYFDLGDDRQSSPPPREAVENPPSPRPAFLEEMHQISLELNEIGRNGIDTPEHPYAMERYHHVVSASDRLAESVNTWSPGEAAVAYEDNIHHQGLGVGAFAAAFRNGQMILIRREDTGLWSMPAGGADVDETWANCARRELREETAVGGQVVDLLALFDMRVLRDPPRPLILAAFLVEPDSEAVPRAMPETLGAGYFGLDDLPELSKRSTVPLAIDLYKGRVPRPHVDLPKT